MTLKADEKKSKWSAIIREISCPECGKKQPTFIKPKNFQQFLWGGRTCVACGCEMDKFGREISK